MRKYTEPTARNLLRQPLVFGVPAMALVLVAGLTLGISVIAGSSTHGNLVSISVGILGYFILKGIIYADFLRTSKDSRSGLQEC